MTRNNESLEKIKLKYLEDLIKSQIFNTPHDSIYIFENGLEVENLIIDSREIFELYNPQKMNENSAPPPFKRLEEYKNPTSIKDIHDLILSGFKHIKLDSDIILTDEDENDFIDGVSIERSVFVDGCGHSIHGNHLSRIFAINHSAIIQNLTFKNCGKLQRHGGAILNNGVTEIKNCKFINGNARFGAGVSNFNILFVRDSLFENNHSRNGGGAIHNEGLLRVCNSEFKNNACERYGGAINSERELIVKNCIFKNNMAEIYGNSINNIGNARCSHCEIDEN